MKERRVAIVTGGTTGIGEKVSEKLVLHGVTVIVGPKIFLCNGPALEVDTSKEERTWPSLQGTYIAAHFIPQTALGGIKNHKIPSPTMSLEILKENVLFE